MVEHSQEVPPPRNSGSGSTSTSTSPERMVMSRADGSSHGSTSSIDDSHGHETRRASADSRRNVFTHSTSYTLSAPIPIPVTEEDEDEDSSSVGILASGLAWVQRNREQRRREYLQVQAEQQLRKIAQATGVGLHQSNRSHDDSSFYQHPHRIPSGHTNRHTNDDGGNDHSEDPATAAAAAAVSDFKIGTQHLSKSGEGASAELDLDLENCGSTTSNDEYLIPKVRIEAEPRTNNTSNHTPSSPTDADALESASASFDDNPNYILTPEQMHQIAIHVLPKTIAYSPWRRLYGLARDGDSFEGCLRIISNVPRTLMVVRTTRGDVFGGYADSSWHAKELRDATFYGTAQACLFSFNNPDQPTSNTSSPYSPQTKKSNGRQTHAHAQTPSLSLSPPRLNVFRWSGKNRYIQLCDVKHKMIAFGGGGANGAFGLCVQEDFQTGSTGACDTFDNRPLCDPGTFEVVDLEFWEFMTGIF